MNTLQILDIDNSIQALTIEEELKRHGSQNHLVQKIVSEQILVSDDSNVPYQYKFIKWWVDECKQKAELTKELYPTPEPPQDNATKQDMADYLAKREESGVARNKSRDVHEAFQNMARQHIRYNVATNDTEWLDGTSLNWDWLLGVMKSAVMCSHSSKYFYPNTWQARTGQI